jgi:hypothetical protein
MVNLGLIANLTGRGQATGAVPLSGQAPRTDTAVGANAGFLGMLMALFTGQGGPVAVAAGRPWGGALDGDAAGSETAGDENPGRDAGGESAERPAEPAASQEVVMPATVTRPVVIADAGAGFFEVAAATTLPVVTPAATGESPLVFPDAMRPVVIPQTAGESFVMPAGAEPLVMPDAGIGSFVMPATAVARPAVMPDIQAWPDIAQEVAHEVGAGSRGVFQLYAARVPDYTGSGLSETADSGTGNIHGESMSTRPAPCFESGVQCDPTGGQATPVEGESAGMPVVDAGSTAMADVVKAACGRRAEALVTGRDAENAFLFSASEEAAQPHGEAGPAGETVARTVASRVVEETVEARAAGRNTVNLDFTTEDGETVRIRIAIRSNVVSGRIGVTDTQTRDVLALHIPELNHRLQMENLVPERFQVYLMNGDGEGGRRGGQRRPRWNGPGAGDRTDEESSVYVTPEPRAFEKWA